MVRMRKSGLAWVFALAVVLVTAVCLMPGMARAAAADEGTGQVTKEAADTDSAATEETDVVSEQPEQTSDETADENGAELEEVVPSQDSSEEEGVAEATTTALEAEPRAAEDYSGTSKGTNVKWVLAGESITIPGSNSWSSSDGALLYRSDSNTWTAGNVSEVTVVQLRTRGWFGNWHTQDTVVIIPRTIEADTFLRFDNSIPNTLDDYGAGYYGPSGNDTGYNKVTVDIKQVIDNGGVPYVTSGGWVYFSFESEDGRNVGGSDADRKNQASNYWDTVIESAADEEDLASLYSHFPADSYFGYVLKKESSTWHIDGALNAEPPVYVVDVYENGTSLFLVSEGGEGATGVDYDEFLQRLVEGLNADDGSLTLTQIGDDSATVTFRRDGVTYTCTIEPYASADAAVRADSAIHVDSKRFGYHEVNPNTYYLCQLNITEPVAQNGALTISKQVRGGAADVNEHFEFTLKSSGLSGNYPVSYTGNSDDHGSTVSFESGTATLQLCSGESATLTLPAGTQVMITEQVSGAAGASTTVSVNGEDPQVVSEPSSTTTNKVTLTVPAGGTTTAAFINTAELQPQTGISSNSTPMIGLLAVAGIGAVAVVTQHVRSMRRDGDERKE